MFDGETERSDEDLSSLTSESESYDDEDGYCVAALLLLKPKYG